MKQRSHSGASLGGSLAASYDVLINGSPLPVGARPNVTEVTVDESVELPGMFMLRLAASTKLNDRVQWVDDESLFAVGHAVEVKLGYQDKLKTLIKGEITAIEPEFLHDRLLTLVVRGYDCRHRLQRGRKTRSFVQQKDSDIASQISSDAGLRAEATDSNVTHDYVLQANQTDLEFLQERARMIEYEVLAEDDKLLFRPVANAESEVLTISFGDDLLEFRPRLTTVGQVSEVEVRGWDVKEKKGIVGKAKTGDEVSTMGGNRSGGQLAEGAFGAAADLIVSHPTLTQAEADQIAKARFNYLSLGLITGEGVCLGRTDLAAGKVIELDGLGERFSGMYYVTAAVHRYLSQRGYRTHFSVRRNAS